jgi:hypothetical protein
MTTLNKDRNYYRMMRDDELMVQAKDKPTPELAVVLAERLAKERLRRNAYDWED